MTAVALDLRRALRNAAAAQGMDIFDEVRNVDQPYAAFGECTLRQWTDGVMNYVDVRQAIHIWSRAAGDAEALQMADALAAAIEQASPRRESAFVLHWAVAAKEMKRPTRDGVRLVTLRIHAFSEIQRGATP